MSYLDNIPGVKDVIDGTGSEPVTLPRRSKMKFTGLVQMTDNPATKTTEVHFGYGNETVMVDGYNDGIVPTTGGLFEGYVLTINPDFTVSWQAGPQIVTLEADGLVPVVPPYPGYVLLTTDTDGTVEWQELNTLTSVHMVDATHDGIVPDTSNADLGYLLTSDALGGVSWQEPQRANYTRWGVVPPTGGSDRPYYTLSTNDVGQIDWREFSDELHGSLGGDDLHAAVTATTAGFITSPNSAASKIFGTSAGGVPGWRTFTDAMHGALSDGTLHAVTSPSAAGFIPATNAVASQVPLTNGSGVPSWTTLNTAAVVNDSGITGSTLLAALGAIQTALGLCLETVVMQTFTASGTYTPTPGMKKCLVILTGPGGGGGGADTDGSSSAVAVGTGGSAGATQIKLFAAATIGASKAIVIGTGGGGGSTSGGDGSAGSAASTFGSTLLVANPGNGGTGSGANNATAAQAIAAVAGASAGTEGDLNFAGGNSRPGWAASSATCTFGISGEGGASWWGVGAGGRAQAQVSVTANLSQAGGGSPSSHYGAGGAGGINLTDGTGVAGGAGSDGICVIFEFIESAF